MPIRGLVFDLFGTLVTRGPGPRAYRELVLTLPPWKWRHARHLALTAEFPTISAFHAHFRPRRGPAPAYFERLVAAGMAKIRLYDDSIPTLARARAEGLRVALLSNLASPYKQPVFELGLDRHFDVLVFSCEVGLAKPERRIYELVADKLELPASELLMIGDTLRDDVRGAKAAGLSALHIDRDGARADLHGLGDELFAHPVLNRG
ncbi:2-haloalkanoic acid dehalogenase [Enhygromyxa salina]|uniref:2-haloalkanoic acid dehalogenase n=1 Tax=Enhygromyxa salina TaxID=215803 RepID=A0A0C1ZM61_9BACT|nr:HAD family hydrolase [Enhygromyxa salina]KIG18574.1 2-haloalkanoic acid dehalogenase [Enhygromyxa salina]